MINGVLSSMSDCRVFLVDIDGKETEISGVISVNWQATANEAAQATIVVCSEIDVDCECLLGVVVAKGDL